MLYRYADEIDYCPSERELVRLGRRLLVMRMQVERVERRAHE
jgi:hypothetical protein